METGTNLDQRPWNWFEIWRDAFLHPTIATYSRISSDPRANIKWGAIWAAITALVSWIVGLQRGLIAGYVAQIFGGRDTLYYVYVFGAPIAVFLGVLGLAFVVIILHGLARLFKGEGTFRQLFFSWAVMQLPFLLLAGLVIYLPSIFSPSSREFNFSRVGSILMYSKLFVALCIYLYLFYAQLVAFSAVEKFGIGKGLGVLVLAAFIVSIIGTCLSYGFQVVMMSFLRYYYGTFW